MAKRCAARSDVVREQFGVARDAVHGPDAEDWLGVPMRRDDRVCGAIVVQSYDRPESTATRSARC
jgi:hypothetical protein